MPFKGSSIYMTASYEELRKSEKKCEKVIKKVRCTYLLNRIAPDSVGKRRAAPVAPDSNISIPYRQ